MRSTSRATATLTLLAAAAAATGSIAPAAAAADKPPTVVKIVPENGATNVDPDLEEILVTFSEPMDNSWSVTGGGEHFPEIKSIRYKDDGTVLEIKVKLKPDWRYQFGLNSPSFQNFISQKGVPLSPVPVTFKTRAKGKSSRRAAAEKAKLTPLGKMPFDLEDVHGMAVSSQDYKGVPIFLAFGAAW